MTVHVTLGLQPHFQIKIIALSIIPKMREIYTSLAFSNRCNNFEVVS